MRKTFNNFSFLVIILFAFSAILMFSGCKNEEKKTEATEQQQETIVPPDTLKVKTDSIAKSDSDKTEQTPPPPRTRPSAN